MPFPGVLLRESTACSGGAARRRGDSCRLAVGGSHSNYDARGWGPSWFGSDALRLLITGLVPGWPAPETAEVLSELCHGACSAGDQQLPREPEIWTKGAEDWSRLDF